MIRNRILNLLIISILFSGFDSISSFGFDEKMYSQYSFITEELYIQEPVLNYQYSFRMISDNISGSNIYDNIIPSCSVVSPIGNRAAFGIGLNSSQRVPSITIEESSYKYIPGDYDNGIDPIAYNYNYSIGGGISKFYIFLTTRLNNYLSTSLKTNILFGNQNHSYQINYYDIEFNGSEYIHQLSGTENIENYINFSGYQFDFENELTIKNFSISFMIGFLYNLKISNTTSSTIYSLDTESIHDIGVSTRYKLPKDNTISVLMLFTRPYLDNVNQDFLDLYDAQFFRNGNGNQTLFSLFNKKKIMYNNHSINSVVLKYGFIGHRREYFYISDHSTINNEQNRFGYLGLDISYLEQNSISVDFLLGQSSNDFTNIIFNISFSNGLKRLKQFKKEE